MMKGTLTRKRSSHKKYLHHVKKKKVECEFCEFSKESSQVLDELSYFWIVKNIFAYDVWDSLGVDDHLMIVPKRHIHALYEFSKQESQEYMQEIQKYERQGYSIYSRSPNNKSKTVPHQHTHFIKLDNRRKKILFFLRQPHVLMYK